jgi:hypothetical protein
MSEPPNQRPAPGAEKSIKDKTGKPIPDADFDNDFPPMDKPPQHGDDPVGDDLDAWIKEHKPKG